MQTKKKPSYPISPRLREFLVRYGRERKLPVSYRRLNNFMESAPLYDQRGRDTLWETVAYEPEEMRQLSNDLTQIYAIMKTEGASNITEHLYVDRIDYCTFGNSNPFRIRVVNAYNDNQDYYYIKRADASRVYGLELEHLLSPNRMHFLTDEDTLIEEHVVGIPGDTFIKKWLHNPNFSRIRLAKELVKFNERCFIRLLGDMRSYNFVVAVTPDVEGFQIRIRAMDFDQQSYSGRKNFYLPQFFKENFALVDFCIQHINQQTAYQYQIEERALIYRRMISESVMRRLNRLLSRMSEDSISDDTKVRELRQALAEHYGRKEYLKCNRMGEIVNMVLRHLDEEIRSPHGNNRQQRVARDPFASLM